VKKTFTSWDLTPSPQPPPRAERGRRKEQLEVREEHMASFYPLFDSGRGWREGCFRAPIRPIQAAVQGPGAAPAEKRELAKLDRVAMRPS